MFEGAFNSQQTIVDATQVLADMLDKDGIDMKTDLQINQIKKLCEVQVYMDVLFSDKEPKVILENMLLYYKQLLVSNNRLSRTEVIDALKQMGTEPEGNEKSLKNLFGSK